jgi:hypothetical protein
MRNFRSAGYSGLSGIQIIVNLHFPCLPRGTSPRLKVMTLKIPGEISWNQTSPSPTMKPSELAKRHLEDYSLRTAAFTEGFTMRL